MVGWALIRGWALINFFCLQEGRLFEVGANLRLGAYSNKYGKRNLGKRSKRDAFTPGLNFLFSIFVSRATASSALYRVLL